MNAPAPAATDPAGESRAPGAVGGVLLDLSGVLYLGDEALPGAVEALARLRDGGLPVAFATNVTRMPRRRLVAQLAAMGLRVDEASLLTAPGAARHHAEQHGLTPHLLVHPDLEEELADLAAGEPDAVLVGDAGEAFTYDRLNRAFRVLMANEHAPLLAMGSTRYFRSPEGLCLDAGPFVAALEFASGRTAHVLGKPAPEFFAAGAALLGLPPGEVVMVGDDVRSDVAAALDAGLEGVLVRTGKYRPGDEDEVRPRGAAVVADFPAAVDAILARREAPR